ncbi:MAG: hypothetical protein FD180_1954 [Planctomycetota bacterium]|nr:MAG: hypothetical protein FD180_1954 [Planctomycetota bacterium]
MPHESDESRRDGGVDRGFPRPISLMTRLAGLIAATIVMAALIATPIVVKEFLGFDMTEDPLRFFEFVTMGIVLAVEAATAVLMLLGASAALQQTRGSSTRISAAYEFVGALAGVGAGIGEGMQGRRLLSVGSLLIGLFLLGLSLNKIRKIGLFSDSREAN